MSVLNENQLLGASGAGGDYEIKQSLRFDDDVYLSRTPSTASNRKTWTWSGWAKRGNLGGDQVLMYAGFSANYNNTIRFNSDNTIYVFRYDNSITWGLSTAQVFRDQSSWYHIVVVVDTTQATSTNRVKLYVNGSQVTAFTSATYPNQNVDQDVNNTVTHKIGNNAGSNYYDGYTGEVNLIDGLALTPDSFGETGDYGEWKPTKYAGAYGTNGFYLPFEQDYAVEGFSTVTYEGNGATQYIGGTGFSPSLVWAKQRNAASPHEIADIVRGVNETINSNGTGAGYTNTTYQYNSFDTDGFTITDDTAGNYGINGNGQSYVAWNWDMGGTTASNTSGSITSSVRANTAYGQSIVSHTGTGSLSTVGHGLSQTPTFIITKKRSASSSWSVQHHEMMTSSTGKLLLDSTAGVVASSTAYMFSATSSVFSPIYTNSGVTMISYCFHDVANYSKFGSYTGNATADNAITTGFTPAFVMIKRTDATGDWMMFDNARNPTQPDGGTVKALFSNTSDDESDTYYGVQFTATGFNLQYNDSSSTNASGGTYIYAAFADTREYAYWYDQSGNNNDWTSEDSLTESDVMLDSPTNNFCTFDGAGSHLGVALSEGNLHAKRVSSSNWHRPAITNFDLTTNKCYWEVLAISRYIEIGIVSTKYFVGSDAGANSSDAVRVGTDNASGTYGGGLWYVNASDSGSDTPIFVNGQILMMAYDPDTRKLFFGKNGTWYDNAASSTASPSSGGTAMYTYSEAFAAAGLLFTCGVQTSHTATANFGQDSSFAGAKTSQGYQDSNGIGDFYYAPPTGFLALCTANLPEPDVIPSENFNTVLYTGNGSTQSIAVGFQPDFTWIKGRSGATAHLLQDTIRGTSKYLISNSTNGDGTLNDLITSFNSNGVSLGTNVNTNANTATYVAWNWKAGGSAVSNTNGTITSSVSANPSAGFSIVSWASPVANGNTIGHGLSKTPELLIFKNRSATSAWGVFAPSILGNQYLYLHDGGAGSTSSNYTPTLSSTLMTVPASTYYFGGPSNSGNNICYAFHSVESYSLVGKYTGNGSTDGTFVHCGFRPAMIIQKRTDSADSWHILDNKRSPSNVVDDRLYPNLSSSESTSGDRVDFISNGFKIRTTNGDFNANGGSYIFLAFAENPFKHSNAR